MPSDLRIHYLRHTCTALLIARGAHPKAIQAQLGHSSIQVTLDQYGHPTTWIASHLSSTRPTMQFPDRLRLVKSRYPHDTLAPVPTRHFLRGSGGLDPAGAPARVGEGAVFPRPIVADGMGGDDLPRQGDLHGVAHH